MGHTALDSFGHELGQPVFPIAFARHNPFRRRPRLGRGLEVPLSGALRHGRQGTHSAVRLKAPSLVKNGLARAFVNPGKQRADHHHVRARCNRLGYVAGVLDAPIGNHWNIVFRAAR